MAKERNIAEDLKFLKEFQQELEAEQNILIEKGLGSNNPKDVVFANKVLQERTRGQKSFLFDPMNSQDFNGYRQRPYEVNFSTLRRMASSTTIVSAIITTRKEQVASYSSYSNDDIRPGWKIEKNIENYFGDDEEVKELKKLTPEDKEEVRKLISFVENCGIKKRLYHGDDIESFLRKFTEDSLTIDQSCFEIIPTRFYKPYEFFAVDGATFRFASSNPATLEGEIKERGYYPYAVQLYQGTISSYYYPWELCMGIRNPTTNIYSNGYGVSEMEILIKIITWILYSEGYNGKFFSQGSNPKGIFIAEGNFSEDKIAELRQTWRAQVAGVDNAWKIPFFFFFKITWQDMQKSNTDMEFYKWLEYLIRLTCAIFKIDPKELGFSLDSDSSVNYDSSVQTKLTYSKEKGLVPLLKFIEKNLNKYIVSPLSNGRFRFKFTGIDDSDQIIMNFDLAKVDKGVMSWKEFRNKYDLPDELQRGDFLLNSNWIQYKQMEAQQSMMQQQQQQAPGMDYMSQQSEDMDSIGNPMKNIFQSFTNDNPFVKDLDSFVKNNYSYGQHN